MKILHINHSKNKGGAAKACLRIHRELIKNNINSKMLTVLKSKTNEKNIECYSNSTIKQTTTNIKKKISLLIPMVLQKDPSQDLLTFDIGTIISPEYINKSNADIIHLHWTSFSTLSIKAISKIKKPIVWTFHDMWPFMGCEHYDNLNSPHRYINGYNKLNKNVKGIDINKIAWKLKKKHWENMKFNIITPSKWMEKCAKNSLIFKNANITHIPYIINGNKFYDKNKTEARKNLSLNPNKKYILFGAFDTKLLIKGNDLLEIAIKNINIKNTELLIFGKKNKNTKYKIPTKQFGYINDETTLNNLYNAADLMIVPSRQDNLPNTVLEAIRCGTPVVAFNIGGIPDMIKHKYNGYLAKPFDTNDLKTGIEYIIQNKNKINFKQNCITHFNNNFAKEITIPKFIELYKNIIK